MVLPRWCIHMEKGLINASEVNGKIVVNVSSSILGLGIARRDSSHILLSSESVNTPDPKERGRRVLALSAYKDEAYREQVVYWYDVNDIDPHSRSMLPDEEQKLWGHHNVNIEGFGSDSESNYPVAIQVTAVDKPNFLSEHAPRERGSRILTGEEINQADIRGVRKNGFLRRERIKISFQPAEIIVDAT